MLQFTHYTKQYGSTTVLSVPGLTLGSGIYWLRGDNGAGKTTLIKSIAGLIPFKGDITVANENIKTRRDAYMRAVNYAEAEPLYPSFLTGNDVLDFYRDAKSGSAGSIAQLSAALGISSYIASKVGTYSSGMAKKLSLVTAFIGQPKLILLDEPLITLDVAAVQALLSVVLEYHTAGVSFLITSHQALQLPQMREVLVTNKTLQLA